jgi:hypothetical protein
MSDQELSSPKKAVASTFSSSSSIYSDDGTQDTNTVGTQVPHPPETHTITDEVAQEHGRFHSQSSVTVSSPHATDDHELPTSNPEDHRSRVETEAEAEARRHSSARLARIPTSDYLVHTLRNMSLSPPTKQVTPDQESNDRAFKDSSYLSFLSEQYKPTTSENDTAVPRPPTPPRRRPSIPSAGSLSLGSIGNVSASMKKTLPTSTSMGRVTRKELSQSPPEARTKSVLSRREAHRMRALDKLYGREASNSIPLESMFGHNSDNRLSEITESSRRQGKPDWHEHIRHDPIEHAIPPGLVSSTGKVYGLGDHMAGYHNGDFITNLQGPSSSQKQQKKGFGKRK